MAPSLLVFTLALAAQTADPMGGGTQPGTLATALANNSTCQSCHRSAADVNMAGSSYRGTMMDLAGVDPIFLAALEIAAYDDEPAAELCIRCHFPRAWLDGRTNGSPEDGFGLEDDDLQGIQCDYCHRMVAPAPTDPDSVVPPPALSGVLVGNSQVFIYDGTKKQGPIGSNNATGHTSEYSPLMEDSVLCAQCHDVSNTFKDHVGDDGAALGAAVPIERTYTEWRSSAYGDPGAPEYRTCQQCHMKTYTGRAAAIGTVPERTLHTHGLVGANSIAPRMVAHLYRDNTGPAFLADIGPDVERVVEGVREQLASAAELEARELVWTGEGWALRVRLTNLTGHKLPTGYAEGRRMFLAHEVRYPNGATASVGGVIDETTWDFAPGEEPARTWEILLSEGLENEHSFHFAKVDRIVKDNRVPPKGFTPQVDTPVVGHEYPLQPDGTLAHYDEVDLPLGESDCWPARVSARLLFQASSGSYLRFLIDNAPLYGPALGEALDAVGAAPELMTELKVLVFPDGRVEPDEGGFVLCEDGPVAPAPDAGPLAPVVDAGPQGEPPPPEEQEGCACAVSGRGPSLPALLGLVLLWLVRRRRTS